MKICGDLADGRTRTEWVATERERCWHALRALQIALSVRDKCSDYQSSQITATAVVRVPSELLELFGRSANLRQ